ncbi:bifunctional fucokinase/fucose pyrophosphorylase [Dendrobium catenatum]|uniref:Bifunctional fucokinase/fucose pyrophosphorylase n=1 Tax=Dendrobium catenatum TaxID=906689 RepID=A0A2I0X861_9ASPA|nr:bifunctional fucokinase/fucose pyrophosphorylase [Dendrobium catenatum]PKU84086.1 Bifunctional fucokinase/fucose pyrophosphorylase [Dendrobium catenatum]
MDWSSARRKCNGEDFAGLLRKSWYHLRLSVRHPKRVPTWDAIVLTAASPEQAALYEWQLERAKSIGRIAESTVTLAVPDPDGARIGSGAATLHAISALARHLIRVGLISPQLSNNKDENATASTNELTNDNEAQAIIELFAKWSILMLHAGGDSKRVPWANPMGKVFLPLPYLAADNPDGPVPLLFDHILAISSNARQAFKNEGGIFIMTGDVLPIFDASTIILPDDASCIITVPITVDIASNHGVVVASRNGVMNESYSLCLVDNLLQKPSMEELIESEAILHDGRTLLDTGIIAIRGKAWVELAMLAYSSCHIVIQKLLGSRNEMSLYEDLVAAWVPAKHEWLKQRPLGKELVNALGGLKMFSYCAYGLSFLHFGTSSEVLDHLNGADSSLVGRRHLCYVPDTTVCDIAASAVILSSKISPGVSIGEDSLVYDSSLSGRIQIGSQSIVVGVNTEGACIETQDEIEFILPNRHCLWEVPLVGCMGTIIIYCGLQDNPKRPAEDDGTFCGKPWRKVLLDLGIQETDLWSSPDTKDKCLWTARIFPVLSPSKMLSLGMWLMGSRFFDRKDMISMWKSSRRVSLEELHCSIDFPRICEAARNHHADLASGFAKACMAYGLLGRDISQLCDEILQKDTSGTEICKKLLSLCPTVEAQNPGVLPRSRAYQVQVDLLRACRDDSAACALEQKIWTAVANETASAVKFEIQDRIFDSGETNCKLNGNNNHENIIFQSRKVVVELPVRVDFVGGWSDTPPWSLERSGCVLNMAIKLEGSLPIRTEIATTEHTGILIIDDANNQLHIKDPGSICTPFDKDDHFRLVKSALLVSGIVHHKILVSSGIKIRTWADVPRGSGLGTSSILAAAVVKGLLSLMREDESNENVARIVLVLEQIMGTGGGWQDQIGGLYPGIKCTYSFPGHLLRLQVFPLVLSPQLVRHLEQRLLVVFTGQVRLANQVLQKVVTRYLRRDNLLISSIRRLAALAKMGREALMNGDIDEVGDIMQEAWRLHQELDPYCSNEFVDKLFAFADPYCVGYKLVGAGGGGFALLLAKDHCCAQELRRALENSPDLDVKTYNWSIFLG